MKATENVEVECNAKGIPVVVKVNFTQEELKNMFREFLNKNGYAPPLDNNGDCEGCRWRYRYQKCSCCKRNIYIKDCYEEAKNDRA